jgi:hypothetical protein
MPLFQYFGWVGSVLLAALLAANWCLPAPIASPSEVSPDQKINIRIHTDHKWPERVVFDTKATMAAQKAAVETGIGESEPAVVAEHQVFDAFAAMAAIAVRPCFRPPCSGAAAAGRENSRSGKAAPFRARLAVRKELTFPSRLQKPPGRS